MTPYTMLSSGLGSHEATALSARLSAWHDAMVAHERRLRAGTTGEACDDECPHAEARTLWSDAVAVFGARTHELTFLRSRAQDTRRLVSARGSTHVRSEAAEYAGRRPLKSRENTTSRGVVASATAATEV
jgi:hypothetical protein